MQSSRILMWCHTWLFWVITWPITALYNISDFINKYILALWNWLITRHKYWLTPVIVIGVLGLSAVLGIKGVSVTIAALVILLVAGIMAAIFVARWPELCLLGLVGSMAIPFNGPSNSNLTLAIAAGMTGLWLYDILLIKRQVKIISWSTFVPLMVLLIVATLSFGFGQLNWYLFASRAPLGAQIAGLALFFLSAGIYLVVAHQTRDVRWIEWTTWLFLGVGAAVVVGRALSLNIHAIISGQAQGSLLWVWTLTIAFSQCLLNHKLNFYIRAILGGLSALTLFVMVTQLWEWNSGWVPPLVSIAVIIIVARPRIGALGIFAAIVAGLVRLQSVISSVMVGDNEYSLSTRLEAWVIIWDIADINPLLGLGPANYYFYTPLFPIRGYDVQFNSHQQYVDLLAQTGILGFMAFVWFFLAVGWVAWKLRNRVPEGFQKAYVYGAIGGVAGTFASATFGDWIIPFFYNITLGGFRASMLSWLFLGGVIAIGRLNDQLD